jgi:hypothetical protein
MPLAKGDGYFYFTTGEAAEWLDSTVRVPTLSSLSLADWVGEFRRLRDLNGQIGNPPEGRPDFSGYYDIPYVPNMAFGKEEAVPYSAAGQQAFKNRDLKDDPTANCWLPGVPRIMQSPTPCNLSKTGIS